MSETVELNSPPTLATLCIHRIADDCILKQGDANQLDFLPTHLQREVEYYFEDSILPQISEWRRQHGNYYDRAFEYFAIDMIDRLMKEEEMEARREVVPVISFVDRIFRMDGLPFTALYAQQMDAMRAGYNTLIPFPDEDEEECDGEEVCTCDRYSVVSTMLGFRDFHWNSQCEIDLKKSAAAATNELQALCRHTRNWTVPDYDFARDRNAQVVT